MRSVLTGLSTGLFQITSHTFLLLYKIMQKSKVLFDLEQNVNI